MPLPGVEIETVRNPCDYTPEQIRLALDIAWRLQRGRFVLTEQPQGGETE